MFTRKLGKLVLGKATPFHLVAACVLGGLLGFAPGFGQAPALWIVYAALLCLLPVNFFLVGLTGAVTGILSLLLAPVSFHVGRALLDGPTQGLFEVLVNAPFTALMGLHYYTTAGGLLVGGLLGFGCGVLVRRGVVRIRQAYLDKDKDSEKFHAWSAKWWVRLLTWVLLGAKPDREAYEKLQQKRVGKPVRIAGVVVAVVLIAGFVFLASALSGPMLTRALKGGLETANGATVDLEQAEMRLDEARFLLAKLAMCDPNELDTDLFRGFRFEADVSAGDLLRRRLHLDKVVIQQALSGAKRDTPGSRTGTAPEPGEGGAGGEGEEEKTLDHYLKTAREWRERLAQVRRWLDTFGGPGDPEKEEDGYKDRLERWVDEKGWFQVAAEHLVTAAPTFRISELRIEGLEAMQIDGKRFDVVGENLSTQPHLLDQPPRLSLKAADGSVLFDVRLAAASRGGGENAIDIVWKGLPVDTIASQLKAAPLKGGTMDFSAKGTWDGGKGTVDLPFTVVLNNTTLSLGGRSETVSRLELPLRVRGPLDDPRILFREQALKDALIAAGKSRLAGELGKQLDERLGKDAKDAVGGLLDRLGGGKKKDEDDK